MNHNLNEINEQKNKQNDNFILNQNNIPPNNHQQSNQTHQLNLNTAKISYNIFDENNYLQRQNINNLQMNNNFPQYNINNIQLYNNLFNNNYQQNYNNHLRNNKIIRQQNENLPQRNNNNRQEINLGQPGIKIYQNQNINFQQPKIFRNGSIEYNELTGYSSNQSGINTNLQGYSFSGGIYNKEQISLQDEPPTETEDSIDSFTLSIHSNESFSSLFGRNNEEIFEDLEEIEMTNEILNKNRGKNCCICLDEYVVGEKISYLPCFHLFHFTCIKEWVKNSNVCPLCKEQIKFDK